MSFLSRKRAELIAAGIDPDRVPPGQYVTDRFPVLHAGVVPEVDLDTWRFTVDGLVAEPRTWGWAEMSAMPVSTLSADIHCVTKWTKLDTEWEGAAVADVWSQIDPDPAASHVLVNAYHGFTANLPIEDLLRPGNLLAHTFGGVPLEMEHGWPMRLVVPHLYFWKSVKWVTGFTLMEGDRPGFWERNGYHMYGDPFLE
ncbi:MAG: sulfite oxidase-like oxidoreductase, partial [Actinobacteria bacterium]|nr:sulfite oxidase-like oxidoreductase [Actinomycetota bacterium]